MADEGGTSGARALAGAVRRLNEAIVDRQVPGALAEELIAEIDELCSRVDGPRRPRYYELDPSLPEVERHGSFLDYSPVSGRAHPLALPLEVLHVVQPDGTPAVEGHARIGYLFEGPPHCLHGGFVASMFDEFLGHALWGRRLVALTAELTTRYRALTPLDQDLVLRGHLEHERGRRWIGRATCHAGDTLTAEAEALFMAVDLAEVAATRSRPSQQPD